MQFLAFLSAIVLFALSPALSPGRVGENQGAQHTQNLVIVTLDGFRWQELFNGADESLLDKKAGGVRDLERLKNRYWRATADERRAALMPFFWNVLAKEGQVFGDPTRKAPTRLTNGLKFSYP